MGKTWMPTTAGILDIIAGSWGLILALLFALLAGILAIIAGRWNLILALLFALLGGVMRFVPDIPPDIPPYLFPIFTALSLPFAIVGILAIVGGIYALQRKIWGLALAGSIAAFFPSWILGLPAIVFTALSKKEFE
jgi:hypothetical protein